MEFAIKTAGGLVILGFGFTLIDFCLGKLLRKMYPDPSYWSEALNSPSLTTPERRTLERRHQLYLNGLSHRFQKWGMRLVITGAILFAVVVAWRIVG